MSDDEKELRGIFCDVFPELESDFDLAMPKTEYEEWDSFTQLELVAEVEQRFKVNFTIEEVVVISSALSVLELIRSKREP